MTSAPVARSRLWAERQRASPMRRERPPASTLWWNTMTRATPGGAASKIFLTRLVSDLGRWPFTARSRSLKVSEPEGHAIAAQGAGDDRAGNLQHRPKIGRSTGCTWRTSAARRAGRAGSSTTRMSWLPGTTIVGVRARSRWMKRCAAWNSPCRARWVRSPETASAVAPRVGRKLSSASICFRSAKPPKWRSERWTMVTASLGVTRSREFDTSALPPPGPGPAPGNG